jgi:hypothetical protein
VSDFKGINRTSAAPLVAEPVVLTPELFEEMLGAYLEKMDAPHRLEEFHHPECPRLRGEDCRCVASYHWVRIEEEK